MARPPRVWLRYLLVLYALLVIVLCQDDDSNETPTSTGDARILTTSIQSFPTANISLTATSLPPDPTNTQQVFEFSPVFQNETETSVAFAIRLDRQNLVAECWFPISGQYGVLPRALFYVTILAALLLRHYPWLYAGALVTALTYSGTTAIHACLLIWRGPATGDLDLAAALAVLSISCIIVVPLLNWSGTLRNIGKNENEAEMSKSQTGSSEQVFASDSRAIVLYWGFLVTVGFTCLFIAIVNFVYYDGRYWQPTVESTAERVFCSPPDSRMDMTAGQVPELGYFILDREFIEANRCIDPCREAPIGGRAIFRDSRDLQLISRDDLVRFIVEGIGGQRNSLSFAGYYVGVGIFTLPFILIQGVFAVLYGRRTPAQVRNVVYALLTRIRIFATPLDPPGPFQKGISKLVALLTYLWALFVLIISIPLVIINISAFEIFLFFLPDNEELTSVGQWSAWAATALVLVSLLAAHYHEDIKYLLLMGIYKTAWLAAHPTWLPQILFSKRHGRDVAKNIFTGEYETMPDRGLFKNTTKTVVGNSKVNASYLIGMVFWFPHVISSEWKQFREFWRNPDSSRGNQAREFRLEVNCGCPIQPPCSRDPIYFDRNACPHEPSCKHTKACKRERRLRLLNPERVGVSMALPLIHNKLLRLDITGQPIPYTELNRERQESLPFSFRSGDYTTVRNDSDYYDPAFTSKEKTHSSPPRREASSPGRFSNLFRFGGRSSTDDGPARPRGLVSQVLQPQGLGMEEISPTTQRKNEGVTIDENPVHPALRTSYPGPHRSPEMSEARRNTLPSVYSVDEAEIVDRELLRRQGAPETSGNPPRVPYPTPDQRSEVSRTVMSDPVSPLNTRLPDYDIESQSSRPSPDSHPDSDPSSGEHIVSPQTNPSPRELPSRRVSNAAAHIVTQLRSPVGLATSFENSISERRRRSSAYTSEAEVSQPSRGTFTYLEPPPVVARMQHNSAEAPIPIHMETTTPMAEAPGDDSYFSRGQTPSDLAASMAFSPETGAAIAVPTSPSTSTGPTPPPKNTPPPGSVPLHRHTLPAPLQLAPTTTTFRPRLAMPSAMSDLGTIDLHHHSHSEYESGASTPAIVLPPLSPPHPGSNTARALRGDDFAMRSPHMVTPTVGMRAPLSSAGSRVQSLEGVTEEEVFMVPGTEMETIVENRTTTRGAQIERTRSPRPPGYRSTVSYLQVQRPSTTMFADEITLRKDEFGVYRLVVNGEEVLE